MATFDINLPNSFVNGTAANDTFNINAALSRRSGWTATTCFPSATSFSGFPSMAAPATTASASAAPSTSLVVFGGDGNDSVFMTSGTRNNVSGGVGNDWLGIGGGPAD